jgi:hypothetical protein
VGKWPKAHTRRPLGQYPAHAVLHVAFDEHGIGAGQAPRMWDTRRGGRPLPACQNVEVVIVLQTSMLISQTRKSAESAIAQRLPTVYGYREHVVDGGLISYGGDLRWCYAHRCVGAITYAVLSSLLDRYGISVYSQGYGDS